MKKFLALFISIILIVSLTACGNDNAKTDDSFYKDYQKMSYTDFNNFAVEKGFSTVENTDNSTVDFKRSFGVATEEFVLLFYELENSDLSYAYFNKLFQSFECFKSEYSALGKKGNYGCYVLKDKTSVVYISYVDNTLLYGLISDEDAEKLEMRTNMLQEFVDYLDYPMLGYK